MGWCTISNANFSQVPGYLMGGCTINNANFIKYLGTYWVGGLLKKFQVLSTLFRLWVSTLNVDSSCLVLEFPLFLIIIIEHLLKCSFSITKNYKKCLSVFTSPVISPQRIFYKKSSSLENRLDYQTTALVVLLNIVHCTKYCTLYGYQGLILLFGLVVSSRVIDRS